MRKIGYALAVAAMLVFQFVAPASAATAGYFNFNVSGKQALLLLGDASTGLSYLLKSTPYACGPKGSSYQNVYRVLAVNGPSIPIVWYQSHECGAAKRICFVNIADRKICSTFILVRVN